MTKQDESAAVAIRNLPSVDALLKDRNYTVFAGHRHTYLQQTRHNRNYYQLATTGASSPLTGPEAGKFDHVTWVTMTDNGPILANLMPDGILEPRIN